MAARKAAPAKRSKPDSGSAPLTASVARLEVENSLLMTKLAAAEQKIALLERQRDEALNRIEWVIDSLNTIAQDAG